MTVAGGMSGLVPDHNKEELEQGLSYNLQCFPLYSLLMALGNPTVNYFSLDIEGAEFLVLQSIPWDKVDIEVMGIELEHAGKVFPGTREEIHHYLRELSYHYVGTVGTVVTQYKGGCILHTINLKSNLSHCHYDPHLGSVQLHHKHIRG